MKMDGNVMRMRELEKGLEIPPGATVTLKPGGLHIMFMGLKAPFAKDAKVPVTLVFEKAGSIDVELLVAGDGCPAQQALRPAGRRATRPVARMDFAPASTKTPTPRLARARCQPRRGGSDCCYIACNSTQAIMAMPITDTNQASVRSQGMPTT